MFENPVERFLEQFAVVIAAYSEVFRSVVYPCVENAGVVLSRADSLGNLAAAHGMFHPEIAYPLVGIGQSEVAALRV